MTWTDEGIERTQGNVWQQERDLHSIRCGNGEATALDRAEVLAQSIDFVDGGAGADQGFVEGDGVWEADLRVERQIEHRRSAAGDEKENEGVLLRLLEHGQEARAALKDSSLGSGVRFFKQRSASCAARILRSRFRAGLFMMPSCDRGGSRAWVRRFRR